MFYKFSCRERRKSVVSLSRRRRGDGDAGPDGGSYRGFTWLCCSAPLQTPLLGTSEKIQFFSYVLFFFKKSIQFPKYYIHHFHGKKQIKMIVTTAQSKFHFHSSFINFFFFSQSPPPFSFPSSETLVVSFSTCHCTISLFRETINMSRRSHHHKQNFIFNFMMQIHTL